MGRYFLLKELHQTAPWRNTNNTTAQITTQSKINYVVLSMASEDVIHCKHGLFNNMVKVIPLGFWPLDSSTLSGSYCWAESPTLTALQFNLHPPVHSDSSCRSDTTHVYMLVCRINRQLFSYRAAACVWLNVNFNLSQFSAEYWVRSANWVSQNDLFHTGLLHWLIRPK